MYALLFGNLQLSIAMYSSSLRWQREVRRRPLPLMLEWLINRPG